MPSMFGGDKKRSIEYFNRALALYGTQMQKRYNWNVLETQLTLAQCYEKTGQVDKAIALCEQVLKSEPNYVYMRDVYLPQLKSSYNK